VRAGGALLMPVPVVSARPDRLGQLRATGRGIADGLHQRARHLDGSVDHYGVRTERAFEVDCSGAAEAVAAFALAVEALGAWVGEVGDAFAGAGGFAGVRFLPESVFLQALPRHLGGGGGAEIVGAIGLGGGPAGSNPPGFTLATAVVTGASPQQVEALAALVGPDRPGGRWLARAASSPTTADAARYLAGVGALTVGVAEARHRWGAEPHRPWLDRAARAGFDGAVAGAASLGGGAGGQAVGTAVCTPVMSPVAAAAVCGPVAAALGSELVRNLGEDLTDAILGDEPAPWERDPEELAAAIAEPDPDVLEAVQPVLDESAEAGGVAADRHADFVMDHPWLWDDEFTDAPSIPNPNPPSAPQPASGPH
jgi:hypothetical protein